MGCDIHLHVEIKVKGKWLHYNHPYVGRWYALFGEMAGVRDTEQGPIASPRGIPRNASEVTKLDYKQWGVDAHSASWLDSEEIAQLEEWCKKYDLVTTRHDMFGSFFGSTFDWFARHPEDRANAYPPGLQDVRFVFWFDN